MNQQKIPIILGTRSSITSNLRDICLGFFFLFVAIYSVKWSVIKGFTKHVIQSEVGFSALANSVQNSVVVIAFKLLM